MHFLAIFLIIFFIVLIAKSFTQSKSQNAFDKALDVGLSKIGSEHGIGLGKKIDNYISQLLEQHYDMLAQKRQQLVTINDYGKPELDSWRQEFDYFFNSVVLSDAYFKELFTNYRTLLMSSYSEQGINVTREMSDQMTKLYQTKLQDCAYQLMDQALNSTG